MSFYNMLFGMNPQSDLLLAVIGLKKVDVERFRDVSASKDGKEISVYTRTGGGNRQDYPNLVMRGQPGWLGSEDDDFDSTYCTDTFKVPDEFVEDVKVLGDIIGNGIRREFGLHLAKTLRREPTEAEKAEALYEAERQQLARTKHFMANGHTFVPMDDNAMKTALELAEANGGELRSAWGIMPITLTIKTNDRPYPNARDEEMREHLVRAEIGYDFKWTIDASYWEHCQKRFMFRFPLTMAKIAESVACHQNKAA
jgi:hypothetical protein